MKDKNKLIITIVAIILAAIVIVGATYAYWSWQSSNEQKTNVTFTVTSDFSCGADGGGSITSQQKILAPTTCTNPNYAFQKPIVVKPTVNANGKTIYMDLYLKVNSIGTYLSQSKYFKYALTTDSQSCTNGLVSSGTFQGTTTGSKVYLFSDKTYSSTTNDLYYLYIWLDKDETDNNTQNQPFDISLGGTCSDNRLPYNGSIYRYSNQSLNIGDSIKRWCGVVSSIGLNTCIDNDNISFSSKAECEATIDAIENNPESTAEQIALAQAATCEEHYLNYETESTKGNITSPFYLKHTIVDDIVTESYVEFVVQPAIASSNTGMTAGTYTLRGGIDESSLVTKSIYEANKAALQRAFGTSGSYCTDYSSDFECNVSGLHARANTDGHVYANVGAGANCHVYYGGYSICDE